MPLLYATSERVVESSFSPTQVPFLKLYSTYSTNYEAALDTLAGIFKSFVFVIVAVLLSHLARPLHSDLV